MSTLLQIGLQGFGFGTGGYLPHGVCFAGRPDMIWLHVASDALIALAYFVIPLVLIYFLRRIRNSLSFNWAIGLFAAFIVLCGTGHVLDVITIWQPIYFAQGVVKAMTAAVSVATAIAIIPLVPRLLAMRTPEELTAANDQLALANTQLEQSNQLLTNEVAAREAAERELRHSLEELGRTAAELEQFAYIASHDLQAPLRNIAGFAQLLERRYKPQLEGDGLEFLDFIGKGIRQMQTLIQDLLQLSRIGRADNAPNLQPLTPTVERALEGVRTDLQARGGQLRHGPLPAIVAVHNLLVQLLQNLFANAIKFQPPGGVPLLDLSVVAEGEYWHLLLRDNGIGIPKPQLAHIFAVFRRLHPQDEYEGTGIGLAICRKIVAHHGGEIWAESDGEGQGACFHVRLPMTPRQREVSPLPANDG